MHLISCHCDCGGSCHGNGDKKKYTSFVRERSVFVYFVRSDGNLCLVPCDVDCGHSASNLTLQFSISQILERSINLFIWYLQKEPVTSSVLLRETWSGLLRPTIIPGSASRDSVAPEAGGSKGDLFYPLPAQNSCGSTRLALDTLEDCISPDSNVHCLGHCQARQLIVLRDMSESGCMWLCFT